MFLLAHKCDFGDLVVILASHRRSAASLVAASRRDSLWHGEYHFDFGNIVVSGLLFNNQKVKGYFLFVFALTT
jgi:hypothetical protein